MLYHINMKKNTEILKTTKEPSNFLLFGVPFTTIQNAALKTDQQFPRWDLEPPQREEYADDHGYALGLRDYADRLIAEKEGRD